MLAALQQPVVCDDGTVVEPTISIGLALTGNPLRSPEDMLRHARLSRQLAEDAGGNRIELADPEFAGLLDLVGIPRADARTL
jgi:GGDEF domain-containing protein